MARGFLGGLILGMATAALGVGALSLALPAPSDDAVGPGGSDATVMRPDGVDGGEAATPSTGESDPASEGAGDPVPDEGLVPAKAQDAAPDMAGRDAGGEPATPGDDRAAPSGSATDTGAESPRAATSSDPDQAAGDAFASQDGAGAAPDDAMPGMARAPEDGREAVDGREAMDDLPDGPAPDGGMAGGSLQASDDPATEDQASVNRAREDEVSADQAGDDRRADDAAAADTAGGPSEARPAETPPGDRRGAGSEGADAPPLMGADDAARAGAGAQTDTDSEAGPPDALAGAGATATDDGTAPDAADAGGTAATPLDRFAAAWDGPDGRPLMSIVLLDDGTSPMGPDAITAFPFPVSFAVSPDHPRAAEVAQAYRDKGFEVLALVGAGGDAGRADVETLLSEALAAVPGAVAVLEAPVDTLPDSRRASGQAASFLEASGHGLVSAPRASNTPQQIAAQAGVPSVVLFRDIDGDGQESPAIRRTLDQGSARAAQEGSAVMLGRVSAATISAVVLWGLQDRGQTLSLAPISAILRASRDDAG